MDSARDIFTKEIIDSELLWEISDVDKDRYCCIGCGAKVIPASFNRKINKKRPYFSISKGAHIQPCDIDGDEKPTKSERKSNALKSGGLPAHFPNKLVLDGIRLVTDTEGFSSDDYARARNLLQNTKGSTEKINRDHTVKTIRSLARLYMQFPHDREKLPLEITGGEGTTYANSFWRLTKTMRFNNPTHLYFAELHWKSPIHNPDSIEWILNAGDWDLVSNQRGRPYRVRVAWSDWSETKKNTLLFEIEAARNEAKSSGGKVKAWLFFIGTQDQNDQCLIIVDKYQAICCIEGDRVM